MEKVMAHLGVFAFMPLLAGLTPLPAWSAGYERLEIRFAGDLERPAGLEVLVAELSAAVSDRDLDAVRAQVDPQFFWDGDYGGMFDPEASAAENLIAALSLDDTQLREPYRGWGWNRLAALVASATTTAHYDRADVVCVPGMPEYADPALAEQVFEHTGTDLHEWGFVEGPVNVEGKPAAKATIVAIPEREAVRVIDWTGGQREEGPPRWAEVEAPDGERGYVEARHLWTFAPERLCFTETADGQWSIIGYVGGGD